MKNLKILIEEEKLQKRIEELAEQINQDYIGEEIILICILKGSIFFTVDLAKKLKNDIKIEFMQVSSYGQETISSGKIDLKLEITGDVQGKDVIIVEDIIDTGETLDYLNQYIKQKKPSTLKICTLLDKPERRRKKIDVDYIGFTIPDKFVIGYGLDYDEYYRNLRYIGYIET